MMKVPTIIRVIPGTSAKQPVFGFFGAFGLGGSKPSVDQTRLRRKIALKNKSMRTFA